MYSGAAAQPCVEIGYAGGDVVADQPHALDPVNTALGGFVGVPDLEAGSGNVLHAGFAPECDHDVNVADRHSRVAVSVRVRVYPGTDGEVGGTVVEDFGDMAGHVVDIGENRIVGPARRWAVALDTGGLVFVKATSWPPSSSPQWR